MGSADFLPCPFCGTEQPSVWKRDDGWAVKCVAGCSITIDGYVSRDAARAAWNARPQPAQQGDDNNELAEILTPFFDLVQEAVNRPPIDYNWLERAQVAMHRHYEFAIKDLRQRKLFECVFGEDSQEILT